MDRLLRGDQPLLEHGDGHDQLEHRSRRVGRVHGPVDERMGGIQQLPAQLLRPVGPAEQAGVEPGIGDHRDDLAGARPEHDHRADAAGQRVLGQTLDARVDGEHQVVARYGRAALAGAQVALERVHGPVAQPRRPSQALVIPLLQTALADRVATAVALVVQDLELLDADLAHVADHVRQGAEVAVVAHRLVAPAHALEPVDVLAEVGHGRKVGAREDLDRLEQMALVQGHLPGHVLRVDVERLRERGEQRVQIVPVARHQRGSDVDGKRGPIRDQRPRKRSVVDRSALRRHHGLALGELLCQFLELDPLDHLQHEQVERQAAEHTQQRDAQCRKAGDRGGVVGVGAVQRRNRSRRIWFDARSRMPGSTLSSTYMAGAATAFSPASIRKLVRNADGPIP